jgi:hypothetical protein
MFEGWFQRQAIRHALKKPAAERFSPGDKNLDAKVVLVGFATANTPEYRLIKIEDNCYSAFAIGSPPENGNCSIPFSASKDMSLTIRHWYRNVEITYKGWFDYFLGTATLIGWRTELFNFISQKNYNRSLKIRDDETEILQAIVDEHLRRRSRDGAPILEQVRIDRFEVVQLVYGEKIWGYPNYEEIAARLDLIIDSLLESKDLEADGHRLIVKGKAVASISSRIQEDRKHRDQRAYNNAIKWLTFGLLLTSLAQVIVAWLNAT